MVKTMYGVRFGATLLFLLAASGAAAQTGVSDDRVSLPDGPGSLDGVGRDVGINANMGTMSWSAPVEVPQGFPGVTPTLALTYDSGAGSGPLGIGWTMSVPRIERHTLRGLPRYDADDELIADGEQLVHVGGGVYRARFERSFVRYTWTDRGPGGHWRAEYPDGTVGFFGARADGTLVPEARSADPERGGVFQYHLVEKVDPFGHAMVYTYEKDGNVPLLQHIGYVFATPDAPTYSVTFRYEPQRDATGASQLSDARGGFDLRLTRRLAEISVFSREERIRRYRLTYDTYADAGGFTRLRQIETLGHAGGVYPAVHRFTYSRALGGVCGDAQCQGPYVVDMGFTGVDLGAGRSTFVDINGDGLPDLLNTPLDGPHRFFLNVPSVDGTSAFAEQALESNLDTAGYLLGTGYVQPLDVNGDGFSDLVNTRTAGVLYNEGLGDWAREGALSDVAALPDFEADFEVGQTELGTIRFLDYDHDRRIDVLRSTRERTSIYRNVGGGSFAADPDVAAIGLGVSEDDLQFADMNGDGLLDPVRVQEGVVRYRLNFGFGRWSDWTVIEGAPVNAAELPLSSLEDLNGDGLADLVIVSGAEVRYAINRNGTSFFAVQRLTSADVEGDIPRRDAEVSVLFADMNANGSHDVVWIDRQGHVQYLDLFPIRPNLLSRIENGLGMVTDVSYATSVQQLALDDGTWAHPLPHPMVVVESIDTYDRLSDVHEVDEYRYHDGFYDGRERSFRGYARVERTDIGDDSHESGEATMAYDVGAGDPYRHGLLLRQTQASAGRPLTESTTTYADCPVAGVPANLERPVRHLCATVSEASLQEGAPEREWVRTRTEMDHDGYGNVIRQVNHGVVGACAVCDRDADVFGQPCGPQCTGDELYTETEFVPPADRWILHAPSRVRTYGRPGGQASETLTYYDGEAFVGLPLGRLTHGRVTRVTQKVGGAHVIETVRNAYDGHGNVVGTLDPLGAPGSAGHRRTYAYDADGLRVVTTDVHVGPHALRREARYEPLFDHVEESTAWMRVEGGRVLSSRRSSFFGYDEFGRLTRLVRPGDDTPQNPTEEYRYELGEPVSRIVMRKRSRAGAPYDLEATRCLDGRGRAIQTRTRLAQGRWQVSGYTVYDARSAPVEVFQPYVAASGECEDMAPDVPSRRFTYDATNRPLMTTEPDGAVTRTAYGPLTTLAYDEEDTDPASAHRDTPTVTRVDGLGRVVFTGRTLVAGQPPLGLTVTYDSLGRLRGYVDAAGHEKVQAYDLAGRLLTVDDPNAGTTTYTWDDAGNLVEEVDGRGAVVARAYDGANRPIARLDPADEATRATWTYDADPECPTEICSNAEGLLATERYAGGGRRLGYDARGRVVFEDRAFGDLRLATRHTWDNANRLVSTTYPDGRTLERRYDDASRLVGIPGVLEALTYDDRGLMATRRDADGTDSTWAYDERMRLASQHTTLPGALEVQGFTYTRDRAGHLTRIADAGHAHGPGGATDVTLDAWYRPTRVAQAEGATEFAYDAIDNVTRRGGVDLDYAVNAVTAAGDLTIRYDDGGYLAERGDVAFTWDFLGRLVAAGSARFAYGAGVERTEKHEDGGLTQYVSPEFEVRDGIAALYVRAPQRVARYESAALATTVLPDVVPNERIDAADARAAEDEALADRLLWSSVRRQLLETGPELVHFHHDHLGSLTAATADGEVVGQRAFGPTGDVRPGAFGDVDTYGFTGQEHDASTGLVHFRFRYLDPALGRWISPDPAFLRAVPAGLSRHGEASTAYAYVANAFFDAIDPLGLMNNNAAPAPAARPSAAPAPAAQGGAPAAQGGAPSRERSTANTSRPAAPQVMATTRQMKKEAQTAMADKAAQSKVVAAVPQIGASKTNATVAMKAVDAGFAIAASENRRAISAAPAGSAERAHLVSVGQAMEAQHAAFWASNMRADGQRDMTQSLPHVDATTPAQPAQAASPASPPAQVGQSPAYVHSTL